MDDDKAPTQYPDEAVVLALSIIKGGGSIREAARAVAMEFGRRPDVATVHRWTVREAEAFDVAGKEKRREWETLAGRVYEAWANRALEAAQAKNEKGEYVLSHSQVMVPYGIAKDGLGRILEAVNPKLSKTPLLAQQFVFYDSKGRKLED